jgi:hypothetical protein
MQVATCLTDAKTAREVLTSFRGLPSWLRVFTLRATDAKIRFVCVVLTLLQHQQLLAQHRFERRIVAY